MFGHVRFFAVQRQSWRKWPNGKYVYGGKTNVLYVCILEFIVATYKSKRILRMCAHLLIEWYKQLLVFHLESVQFHVKVHF